MCIDLLRKFEDELGFSYDLVRVADAKWGTLEVCIYQLRNAFTPLIPLCRRASGTG